MSGFKAKYGKGAHEAASLELHLAQVARKIAYRQTSGLVPLPEHVAEVHRIKARLRDIESHAAVAA